MKREAYWDNVKGILILLVVLTHFMSREGFLNDLYSAVYLFHMPLFVFVSGLFHKNTNIKTRVISLLLIGIVYNIFLKQLKYHGLYLR